MTTTFQISDKTVRILHGENVQNIVYMNGHARNIDEMLENLSVPKPYIVLIEGTDWNASLSPWNAPALSKDSADFSGNADIYISQLCESIIPKVETSLNIAPKHRTVAGYSLSGLFAIYCLFKTDIFDRAASISGSLWFDGFTDFVKGTAPLLPPDRLYFSVGSREKRSRNQRMAQVEKCTSEIFEHFKASGIECAFELNPGGHFNDSALRISRGINWICR